MSYNKVILMGNLTKDPELKTTNSGTSVATFTIAVARKFAKNNETDFINCVAWRNSAEFVSKWFSKGSAILVEGSLQVRSYDDKNGKKCYATEVIVDNAEFAGKREESSSDFKPKEANFTPVDDEEDLPFNLG